MAIGIELTNELGAAANYHRISKIVYDIECNQLSVEMKSYAGADYRNLEKEQGLAQIDADIALYYKLSAKEGLTGEETATLTSLNIQELEARKYTERHLRTLLVTIGIMEDIRDALYKRLCTEIPLFEGSAEV